MITEYAIKSNTDIDYFFNKYPGFLILFQDEVRNIHYFTNPFGIKMKFGYDMNRFINYVAIPTYENIYPTLCFIVDQEKAQIMPMNLFRNLKKHEMLKTSGKEDYFMTLNFERITQSFKSFMEKYPHLAVDEYSEMLFEMYWNHQEIPIDIR
jgi:hypothetical protein